MRLRVDWLETPLLRERDVAGCADPGVTWWADPAHRELLVGVGVAVDGSQAAARGLPALVATVSRLRVDAHADAGCGVAHGGALWLGAGPFDPARASGGAWGAASAACWRVPRVALRIHAGRGVCAVAGARDREQALRWRDAALGRVCARGTEGGPAGPLRVAPDEAHDAFRARVRAAVSAIARGELQKVVLARSTRARAGAPFAFAPILRRLAVAEPDAVRYSLPLAGGRLVGATPERLVRIERGRVIADAVAGSTAREAGIEGDARAAARLRLSKKDQEEHAWVRDAVEVALEPRVEHLIAPEAPGILSTGGLHHLHTPFRAARGTASVLDLAAAMQPTPAVAGVPTAAALAWLRAREPLARGGYAGPFGWAGLDGEGGLAVALRCALIDRARAVVFAGAGIVAGSDAEAELEETRLKMRAMLGALEGA